MLSLGFSRFYDWFKLCCFIFGATGVTQSGFQLSVESNQAIILVLVSVSDSDKV